MNYFWMGVYLVNFKSNEGGELNGKHYAIILSKKTSPNKTLVVIPLTSKKKGKKYRGGFSVDVRPCRRCLCCDLLRADFSI